MLDTADIVRDGDLSPVDAALEGLAFEISREITQKLGFQDIPLASHDRIPVVSSPVAA
jgi:hypothetical protein